MKTLKTGQEETAAAADKNSLSFGKLTGGMAIGNLLAQGAISAYDGIKNGIGGVLKAADDWATAQAQLNAGIKSTGDISGVTAEAATELAESIQKTTPISRESALTGEDMLLTFTSIGKDVFPQATKAVDDMATRMNGGLTPNAQMLSNTAIQVGKALQDPVKGIAALHRVGVEFTDQQKEQIKTMVAAGDTAGAQKLILAELGREFGGSASAALDTFAGKQQQMQNNMDDAKATIGAAIEQAIKPFQTAIGNFVNSDKFKKWVQDVSQYVKDFAKILQNIGTFYLEHKRLINDLAQVVLALGAAFFIVSGALRAVAIAQAVWNAVADTNPILLAITVIIAVILLLITHWHEVTAVAEKVWHDVSGFFSNLASDIGNFIGGIIDWIKQHWPLLLDILLGPFGFVLGWVIQNFGKITGFMSGLWDTIKKDASKVEDFLTAPFRAAFNLIAGFWNKTMGSIDFKLPDWIPGVGGKGFSLPKLPMLAGGTSNFAGGMAIVGEQGAELVNLPQGAQVTPASQTSTMLNNLANNSNTTQQTVNVNVTMGMYAGLPSEKRQIAVDLYKEMTREARAHGVQLPQIGSVSVQ
jgi:hypothetical protein